MRQLIMAAVGVFALVGTATAEPAPSEFANNPLNRPLTVEDEVVNAECGDCHMTFAPSRLPSGSWKKIIAGLSNHFGDDASLDPKTAKYIEDYLVAHAMDAKMGVRTKMRLAAWKKKGLVDPMRITLLASWKRHHNQENYFLMSEDVKYKRGSNCSTCHKGAKWGYYETFDGQYGKPLGAD